MKKLDKMKQASATQKLRENIDETFAHYDFPSAHWRRIRTNNPLELIMKEIRRRTNVVGAFPDGNSALMLVAARLRHIAGTRWSTKRYLNMDLLREMELEKKMAIARKTTERPLPIKSAKNSLHYPQNSGASAAKLRLIKCFSTFFWGE